VIAAAGCGTRVEEGKYSAPAAICSSWFDVSLVYVNQRRAIIAIEKGAPGERAFNEAFAAWGEYLWTRGTVPDLRTYLGSEVPNPLHIEIVQGYAALESVMNDVMALTKVNFNGCMFADGLPVTLRFADSVAEILTSAPLQPSSPWAFKHYI
jgi:hypothetical protein